MSDTVKIATRESYGNALAELGKTNDKVYVLDADLGNASVEFCHFIHLILLNKRRIRRRSECIHL